MDNQRLIYDLLNWDDERIMYAKGHFTPEEFCEGAKKVYSGTQIAAEDVHHTYARWIPVWGSDYDNNGHFFMIPGDGVELRFPCEPKRGAFPITYAQRFYCPEIDL